MGNLRSTHIVRLVLIGAAGAASVASVASGPKKGPTKTVQEGTLTDVRPTFRWPAQQGARYRLMLYRVPQDPRRPRQLVGDVRGVTGGSWTVPDDLEWGVRYELFLHYAGNTQVLTSWGFTIGFDEPVLVAPAEAAAVPTLTPTLRIAALDHPHVAFELELAEDPAFTRLVERAVLVQADRAVADPGPDGQAGTDDDARVLAWTPTRMLQIDRTYHWRLRAHHFRAGQLAPGAEPDLAAAAGASEATGTFVVPPQAGPDALDGLTWLVNEPGGASMAAIGKKLDLAYVAAAADGGAAIRIAPVPARSRLKVPAYGEERQELTATVQGSRDLRPTWDVDGKGLFFDSDRAQGIPNVWLKKRDSSSYTQITFHDRAATHVTLSKDGKRIAYQVAGAAGASPTIWIADRDGKNALELGPGEHPRLSPDGKRIAFAVAGDGGARQIWISDTAGGERIQVTRAGDAWRPVWRPDGRGLVFVSDRAGNDDLWMVDIAGGEPIQLTTYLGRDTDPELTPDGKYLLFTSWRGGEVPGIWMGALPPLPAPSIPEE